MLLLIEVPETTLSYNRSVKPPLYACSGIPEIRITGLTDETIGRHTDPSGGPVGFTATYNGSGGEKL